MITTTSQENSTLKAQYRLGYIWLISIVAALGGLLFGYDWVVIGGAKPFFERYFHLTDAAQSGWANSCALIGCLVGALVAGALSDKFGRKRLLILSASLFAITSIGNALAPTFAIFIGWRMLSGVAIGLASNLSPMYVAEIAVARGLAEFCAGTNVTVNSVLPGPTRSDGVDEFVKQLSGGKPFAEFEKEFFEKVRPTSLLKRFATTEEVANLVTYVCSPLSSATNGAALRVDGGVVKSAF